MMKLASAILAAVVGLLLDACLGVVAGNEATTLVLHAQSPSYTCDGWLGAFDCSPGSGPRVDIQAGEQVTVYVLLRNYTESTGAACRFSVDGGEGNNTWGDWVFLYGVFSGCQTNHHSPQVPSVDLGYMVTSFDCVLGGALLTLGWMELIGGSSGCLSTDQGDPAGTRVLDCAQPSNGDPIAPQNRGRICVGSGGYDACESVPVLVDAVTWGTIKGQYR